ncbi:MAG: OmpA family protein [Myxococcales bacterium]|nr:OmpA family protein [Myxococcales bacterium]
MRTLGWMILGPLVALSACGHSAEELQVRDARIAELDGLNKKQAEALATCDQERETLNKLVGGLSADAKQSQTRLEAMQKALAQVQAREAQAQARLETFRSMLKQLKSMIDSGKLRVRIVRNRMVVELPEAVLFDSGKADLKEDGKAVVAELAPILASLSKREFQVGGHTDNVPIKTRRFPSNWELSATRAVNVAKLLTENGVESTRVSAAGYADSQPVESNDTPEGRAKNRRIEIALLPNLDELPDLSALEGD